MRSVIGVPVIVLCLKLAAASGPAIDEASGVIASDFKSSFCQTGAGWEHEFADEFNGEELDSTTWEKIITKPHAGSTEDVVSGLGVTACRSAHCRAENVYVKDGALHLHSQRGETSSTTYFTGAVTSKGKRNWQDFPQYRLCVSAKLPGTPGAAGKGVWPAHWMLPDNGVSDQCLDEGEMDIMEMVNSDGGVYNTFHWMSSWPKMSLKSSGTCPSFDKFHKSKHKLNRMPTTWSTHFHEYGVERSGEHMAFAVDGVPVLNVTTAELATQLSHTPFFLILNTAIGGAWPGEPSSSTVLPTDHAIDYVRVVRKAGGGASGVSSLIRTAESSVLEMPTERAKVVSRKRVLAHRELSSHPSSFAEVEELGEADSPPPPPLSVAHGIRSINDRQHKVPMAHSTAS